jgi:hypothetical protein
VLRLAWVPRPILVDNKEERAACWRSPVSLDCPGEGFGQTAHQRTVTVKDQVGQRFPGGKSKCVPVSGDSDTPEPIWYRMLDQLPGAFVTARGSHPSFLLTDPAWWISESHLVHVLYARGDLADPRNVVIYGFNVLMACIYAKWHLLFHGEASVTVSLSF